MTDKKRKTIGAIALVLGLIALMLLWMFTALHAVGTDDRLYFRLQMRAGVLPAAGISEDDLRMLDGGLADYLGGDIAALNDYGDQPALEAPILPVEVFGTMQPAFNEKEMSHLLDCYNLFALLRKVRSRLIPWAILLIVGGAWLLNDRKKARRCAWLSPLILLIPLGAFAAWAAVDFDGAFTFFHRVLFTNDLWLLDPRTDLLIRICPQSMFMAMGLRIALWCLAALIGVPALATALIAVWPRQKGKEDNTWNDNRTTRRGAALRQKTFDFGAKR